jgi:ferrous iron transport protein A
MKHQAIPLTEVTPHQECTLVELHGGRTFVSRLATLGFIPGAQLSLVQNFGHGPLIVLVRDARIALGRGEAAKVMVRTRNAHDPGQS